MAEQKSSKGLIIGLAVVGVLLVVGIVAGGIAFAIWGAATERKSSIPERLGADVQMYGTFTPALSDLANVARLRGAYPELFIDEDPEPVNEPLKEWGMSFQEDIQPWLGAEVAFAIGNLPQIDENFDDISDEDIENLEVALLAYSTNDEAAGAFLEKLRTAMLDNEGDRVEDITTSTHNEVTIYEMRYAEDVSPTPPLNAFAVTNGIVVMANTDYIKQMIDREPGGADSLSSNPKFAKFQINLPPNRFSYFYMDAQPLIQLNETFISQASEEMPEEQADMLEENLAMISAMESLGLAAGVAAEGVFIESVYSMNLDALSEDKRAVFTYQPGDLKARLDRISSETLAFATFSIQPSFKDQVIQAIEAQPDGAEQREMIEAMYEVDLEEDLLNWFNGDASLVILPGEELGDFEVPATVYFTITPSDREAAETGINNITDVIENLGMDIPTEDIAGVEWWMIQEPDTEQTYGGYGFVGDDLVIAFGEGTMETAVNGGESPISGDARFQELLNNLPAPERGMVYMDIQKMAELAEDTGADVEEDVREGISSLQSLGMSGNPSDNPGVIRARLFLYIAE
jgi:hypothetical protein